MGIVGQPGEYGNPGERGDIGLNGRRGYPGQIGDVGVKGEFGDKGTPGYTGKDGLVGRRGEFGYVGPKGWVFFINFIKFWMSFSMIFWGANCAKILTQNNLKLFKTGWKTETYPFNSYYLIFLLNFPYALI